ncbi:MAG: glutamate racemase [Candidatus Omnitrophica bacterium]|nr:glutamate racemase [Candidatus Omnitrophota bacterium]
MLHRLNPNSPIGVFDSGLGGLTVVKELLAVLPDENIVYFGDTARVPYGTKSRETIIRYSREIVGVLLKYKVKMVVVACNTASSLALDVLKKECPVPVVGVIDPGAKKAALSTKSKKVGIIATSSTIKSGQYARRLKVFEPRVRVMSQPCPLFVPLVEEGWLANDITRRVAHEYLDELKKAGVDTLILGCTHYPLLKRTIASVMGPGVMLIDSAREVALEVKHILRIQDILRAESSHTRHLYLVSDEPDIFKYRAVRFLGTSVKNVRQYSL